MSRTKEQWIRYNRSPKGLAAQARYYKKVQARRRIIGWYKHLAGCARCGLHAHPALYDFHHIDPRTKESRHTVLNGVNGSWSKILDEMDKCEVLCANCHRLEHASPWIKDSE